MPLGIAEARNAQRVFVRFALGDSVDLKGGAAGFHLAPSRTHPDLGAWGIDLDSGSIDSDGGIGTGSDWRRRLRLAHGNAHLGRSLASFHTSRIGLAAGKAKDTGNS